MSDKIQTKEELEAFYVVSDPWEYDDNADDDRRKMELLSLLSNVPANGRTLDIGCGNGYITFSLPGDEVIGVDISEKAINWCTQKCLSVPDNQRFKFQSTSIFELSPAKLGHFDLIVITGVLYPQYIGRSFSVVKLIIDELLNERGNLASCHISEWNSPRFPYSMIDMTLYPYREYTHRLEIFRK